MICLENILKTSIIGLFYGTFGTTIGGIIGIMLNKKSNKFLSFILSLSSGLMMSVVCFDLILKSLEFAKVLSVIMAVGIGAVIMIICDVGVQERINSKKIKINENESLLKIGIILSIGLALHNIPEGLAIRGWIWSII